MTLVSTKKIFFLSGNLKTGKGIIQGIFPSCYNEPEKIKCEWQINVSFISFVNKTASELKDVILISTNLIRDTKINELGETEIWNPHILHIQLSGNSNSFQLGQNTFSMSSFSTLVTFYFTEMKSNMLFTSDVDIRITIILERKLC